MFKIILLFTFVSYSTNFSQNDYLEIYKESKNIYAGMFFSNYESEINEPYNLDVYGYFNLDEKYHTPLKRKIFEKSTEYIQFLDSLKTVKKNMLNKWYNVETGILFGHNYDLETGKYVFNGVKEYNSAIIDRGYFTINGVYFPQLYGFYSIRGNAFLQNVRLQFSCSEEAAVKLEDIEDVKLVFLFKVGGVEKIHFNNAFGIVDYELPIAKNVVLLIMDDNDKYYGSIEF